MPKNRFFPYFAALLVSRVSIRFSGPSIVYPQFIVPLAGLCLLLSGALTTLSVAAFGGVFGQVATTAADASAGESESEQKRTLVFDETVFQDIREGYLELSWSKVPSATSYSVTDASGSVFYRGAFPRAFISGLSSGEYVFSVTALDSAGQVVARVKEPAKVSVQHWPLYQAWISFGVGLVVFVAIVFVIIRGAFFTRQDVPQQSQQAESLASPASEAGGSGAIDRSEEKA